MTQAMVQFKQGISRGISTFSDNVELVNLFVLPTPGARSETQLVSMPGGVVRATATPQGGDGARGIWIASTGPASGGFVSTAYVVIGNTLYRYKADDTLVFVGVVSSATGDVSFSENQDQTLTETRGFVCDGTTVYEWDLKAEDSNVAGTFLEVAQLPEVNGQPGVQAIASYITYNTFRLILTCANSVQWYFSGIAESNFPNDQFYSSESNPDKTVRVITHAGNLYVFSAYSYDIYAYTGTDVDPFNVPTGGTGKIGAASGDSVASHGDYLFWLGQGPTSENGVFMADAGGNIRRVSSPGVEEIIKDWKFKAASKGFAYTDRGNTFYVLTSIEDKYTLVYNVDSGLWHRCSSANDGKLSFWDVAGVVNVYGRNLYVTHRGNQICEFVPESGTDHNGWPVTRYWSGPVYIADLDLFKLMQLTIDVECGTTKSNITEPQVYIQVSWDGGKTWGNRMLRGLGVAGRYKKMVTAYGLGAGRNLVVRFGTSADLPVVFYQMRLIVEKAGRS